jgi:cytochrome c-type biogenesis protein CcmF
MISLLGHLTVDLALGLAAAGAVAGFAGMQAPEYAVWARRAAFAVAALVAFAVLLMEIALVRHDFSVKYVADVGGTNVPLYYTLISLWAALEGSILFWAFLLCGYTVTFLLFAGRRARAGAPRVDDIARLQPAITGTLLTISTFFLLVIAGPGDPFAQVNPLVACQQGCNGPNPLLQNHWMMGVHPVLLYLGYVGLSVPFAVTIAALLRGVPSPEVLRVIRRWSLIPWVFLSLGIVAGMWWSYAVLGWGGYWSWDPVENASVMPWLVSTAFLHSLQVQERRGMLKTWTMSLIVLAFLFSVFGTFLTRSGVLASVHSFTASGIGPMFLGFFGLVLIGSLALLLARSRELAAPGALDASVCRETAFLVNNLLLLAATSTILLGTIFPLIAEAAQGSQLAVGAPYFNSVAVPIGFALLFLMGIGPALPWGATRYDELQYRLLGPVALGVGVILLLLLLGVHGVMSLLTFGGAAFVLAVTLQRIGVGRSTLTPRPPPPPGARGSKKVGQLLRGNPRRYGGYVVHLGVLLVIVGIAASQTYAVRAAATLRPGGSLRVDGYTLTYHGYRPILESDKVVIQANVAASRAGEALGTLHPSQNVFRTQVVVTPAVREEPFGLVTGIFSGRNPLDDLGQLFAGRNPFEDLYIVLEAPGPKVSSPSTIQVLVNPMVGFIWLGGLVMGLGGVLALLPARRRRRTAAAEARPERAGEERIPLPAEEAAV